MCLAFALLASSIGGIFLHSVHRVMSLWKSDVFEDVHQVEFMDLAFTRMPGVSYHRQLRSLLLCLCDIFLVLINQILQC